MTTTDIVLSIIGVIGTCSSILFAYLVFKRNDRGDRRQEGRAKEF